MTWYYFSSGLYIRSEVTYSRHHNIHRRPGQVELHFMLKSPGVGKSYNLWVLSHKNSLLDQMGQAVSPYHHLIVKWPFILWLMFFIVSEELLRSSDMMSQHLETWGRRILRSRLASGCSVALFQTKYNKMSFRNKSWSKIPFYNGSLWSRLLYIVENLEYMST